MNCVSTFKRDKRVLVFKNQDKALEFIDSYPELLKLALPLL